MKFYKDYRFWGLVPLYISLIFGIVVFMQVKNEQQEININLQEIEAEIGSFEVIKTRSLDFGNNRCIFINESTGEMIITNNVSGINCIT